MSLVAAGVLPGLRVPPAVEAEAERGRARPWRQMVAQPTCLIALFGAVTGYGIMILAMTATPIAVLHHHHELGTAATVIQLHVLGMFAPSFFTGALIPRFGVLRIMQAGVVHFLYIGGTTLLTTAYAPAERARAQAINDMTIFVVGLAGSFAAGGMLEALES